MRLHRLRVQAFGPFAGVEEVDVDALCAHGLFLLHGPTGAGKTSVLDAVCFALYGRVPGARAGGAPRLRSDHAAPALPPEVTCEISVAGRHFEVTRSPAWERPKKRGEGTTTEQARTTLRERVDGRWIPRSARNDEASQLLTEVLGMGLEQFTKVVLLPQGEFAAFLRCPAEERRPLLERLFGTDRFSEVERWLAEERRRLTQQVDDVDAVLARLVARAHQCVAGLPLPDELVRRAGSVADAVAHLDRLHEEVRQVLAERRQEHARGSAERTDALARREEGLRRLERLRRLTAARAEQRELEASRAAVERVEHELVEARRAESLAGHLAALSQARAEVARCAQVVRHAEQALEQWPEAAIDGADVADLAGRARDLRDEIARLTELVAAELELEELTALSVQRHDEEAACAAALAAHDESADDRERRRQLLRAQVALVTEAAGDLPAARAALDAAVLVESAARAAATLGVAVQAVAADVTARREVAVAARTRWLDVRERRLEGMAAELAAALRAGQPCAVCGSTEHPRPADAGAGRVSAEAEDLARQECERAEAERSEAEAALAARREEHAARLAECAALSPQRAEVRVAAARERVSAAQAAATALSTAQQQLAALEQAAEVAGRRRSELVDAHARARAAAAAAGEQVEHLRVRVTAARGGEASVSARIEGLHGLAEALEALVEARAGQQQSESARERIETATADACGAAGFPDVAAAQAAARPPDVIAALQTRSDEHRQRAAALRTWLREPDLLAAAADSEDADAVAEHAATLEQAARDAEERVERATRALALCESAAAALADLRAHAAADSAAADPLRQRAALVGELARCVEGTGGDNALRMRLSAYVLAARLEQVAEAATVRLAGMSGGRYALVHSDAAERRGARSGLGLRVVDAWTGRERDTCTLSGGESFLASLALALGLADVVQAEAGGAAIETLFVDEGFGSLDDDTLEEAMATLDGLREGGRAVGLVSHVPELRNRIPNRLEVVKTRTGSHLRTDGAGALAAEAGAA